jgi:hypothetical protein
MIMLFKLKKNNISRNQFSPYELIHKRKIKSLNLILTQTQCCLILISKLKEVSRFDFVILLISVHSYPDLNFFSSFLAENKRSFYNKIF